MKKIITSRLMKILALTAMLCLTLSLSIACGTGGGESTSTPEESVSIQDSSRPNSSTDTGNSSSPEDSSTGGENEPTKGVTSILVGSVRVQLLSDTVVRIEDKYEKGYEDRPSYIVQNRTNWYEVDYTTKSNGSELIICTKNYNVHLLRTGTAADAYITAPDGELLWDYSAGDTGTNVYLPSPSDELDSWYFTDSPRVIPSEYGYTPTDSNLPLQGWDFSSEATDIFVFLPQGNYTQFCDDYIKVTGEAEMTPLQMLGYWDSRWYAYSAETALQQIQDYTDKGYSIDVLVIDTDWRVGASLGYQVNEELFPDMAEFLEKCEELNIDIAFNDHPEPVKGTTNGLDKAEVEYRSNELTLLLSMGLDYWWYDRNWSVCLNSADPDISVFAFGMYAYQWITRDHLESITDINEYAKRALIMGNVDGCLHGKWNYASDLSAHRYSIQWTGDIGADTAALSQEIYTAVFGGAEVGLPYMSSDVGGHTQAVTNDMYVRWIQYGALSTICRVHCTTASYINGQEGRMPWLFGETAEEVAKAYVGMRYRLLPLYYHLSRENYDTGLPIMRRLDILYPDYVEASANDQYLLGDYLLVAPIDEATVRSNIPDSLFTHEENGVQVPGLKAEYFNNATWSGTPSKTKIDKNVNFNWETRGPAGVGVGTDNFSVKWTGKITIGDIPVALSFFADDTVIVYLDGKMVINGSGVYDTYLSTDLLAANSVHDIEIRYAEFGGGAHIYTYYVEQQVAATKNTRTVFIPDGTWIDVWSGERYVGPATYTVAHELKTSPIFVREGALIVLAPDMKNTHEKDWSELVLDVYPSKNFTAQTTLYEDDTETVAYKHGESRSTDITMEYDVDANKLIINVGAAKGAFSGKLAFENRKWNLRIHTNPGWGELFRAKVNGQTVSLALLAQSSKAIPFAFEGASPDGDIYTLSFDSEVYESYVIELYYDSAVDSQINEAYDRGEVEFNVKVEESGSAINLDQEGVFDWISYGEENADSYIRKEGGNAFTLSKSYDLNWASYDNFFTKYFNEGEQSRGSISSQKDFEFQLNVTKASYYVIYLGGYQATAKLSVRDRAGNVETSVFGNINGQFLRRVVIEVPKNCNGTLYVTYSALATEPVGTGTSTYLTLLAVIAADEIPTEEEFVADSVSASATLTNVPSSVCLSEAGASLGEATLDWRQFGDDGGVTPVQKINGNIINSVSFRTPGIFNDYQSRISYYDGLELGAHTGTTKGTCTPGLITINLDVTTDTKHVILYTGAWKATNTVEVYNRAGELIAQSESFTAGSSAVNKVVTIALEVTKNDSIVIFIRSSNENGGNVSLAGIAITGEYTQDATASLSSSTEIVSGEVDLSSYSDWQHVGALDEKADADVIKGVRYNQYAVYENYAAAISYTNGANGSAEGLTNGVVFDYFIAEIAVDENTQEIVLYATVNTATAAITVLDENGRTLLTSNEHVSSSGRQSIKITLSVEALSAQTLTLVYYKGGSGSGSAGLAAIAVN